MIVSRNNQTTAAVCTPRSKTDPSELAAALDCARIFGDDGKSVTSLYEADLAAAFGVAEAIAVSSDSAMISVVCGALRIAPGEEVIVLPDAPAWVLGALHQGRITVLTPDGALDAVERLLTPRCRAILLVMCDANPARLRALRELADRAKIPLVLDISLVEACALTVTNLAWQADVTIFATSEGQALSTGEGGVLLLHDVLLAEAVRSYAQFGRLDGMRTGANHKISPVQAAIGRVRLRRLAPQAKYPPQHHEAVGQDDSTLPDRFAPHSLMDESELSRALSGDISGASGTTLAYESALADWFSAEHAVTVSSGYAAVLVALTALNLVAGDEVLLTPTCPLCTVFALTSLGVVPVFCDTRQDGFSIDLEKARQQLSSRTRAILEIPMWGYPVPADEVATFARANGLAFVLDLALGHGTELHGQLIWHYADIATFSTHSSKIFVTGEGGFILTGASHLAAAARRARHYGARAEGLNYRLAGVQAALGLARLPLLSEHIDHRRNCIDHIAGALTNPRLAVFPTTPGGRICGVKMLVRDRFGQGASLNEHLARNGIPSDILTYRCRPLYEFPVLADRRAECPNASRLFSEIASMPVHPGIGPLECNHIIQTLNSYREGCA